MPAARRAAARGAVVPQDAARTSVPPRGPSPKPEPRKRIDRTLDASRLRFRRFLFMRLEEQARVAGEDDGLAAVLDPEALGIDVTEGAVAFDGIVALSAALGHVDMGAVGLEGVALVLEQLDIAEEVEQLGLWAVDPAIGRDREPRVAVRGHVGLGGFELDEIVDLRALAGGVRGHRERT